MTITEMARNGRPRPSAQIKRRSVPFWTRAMEPAGTMMEEHTHGEGPDR